MPNHGPDEPHPGLGGVEPPPAPANYPASEIARALIPVCGDLLPAMADLSGHYAADMDILQDVVLGLAPLAANLPDDAPLTRLYSDLLAVSHIAHTIRERCARIDWTAPPDTPRAAAQLVDELASLLLLAMDCDDEMERIRAILPSISG